MPKHVIRIPPLKAGRSVRWTFEVSAADDAARGDRAKKARKKRQAKQQAVKGTRMARVRREPEVASEWATTSEPSLTIPNAEPGQTTEPMPVAAMPAIEAAPAMEAPQVQEMVTAAPATPAPAAAVVVPIVMAQAPPQRPAPVQRTRRLRPIAYFAASVGLVATLAFPRQPLTPGTNEAAGSLPTPSKQTAEPVAPSSRLLPLPAATVAALDAQSAASRTVNTSPKKTLTAKPEKHHAPESTTSAAHLAAAKPIATISLKDATTKLPGAEPIAPLAPAPISTSSIGGGAPVTITGCLEVSVDHDEFRLTDTDGAAAPKSRSWRTGFLKKRSAPVALIAPPDAMALQTHVGHRVSATGVLTSHDLKVSTFRVVGPACN
jgi:hypothetical protein